MPEVKMFDNLDFQKIGSGFEFIEGPVWFPDGEYLIFSDLYGDKLWKWSEKEGAIIIKDPSGKANGNARDKQGRLITCEHISRNLTRTELDGGVVNLASHYKGKHINSPNDVVVKSDGYIYFSDPRSGIESDRAGKIRKPDLDFCGVYKVHPDTKELSLLVDDFERPNGLAFSPDESLFYIVDTIKAHIRVFDVDKQGALGNGRLFANVGGAEISNPELPGRPDGMKVDVEGNVYCTGSGPAIYVFWPNGELKGIIKSPNNLRCANIAWGESDWKSLFVCASTELYRVRMDIPGVPS